MKKLRKHIKAWNQWRKGNLNSPIHKIAVLFGAYSPSFIGVKAGMNIAENIEKIIMADIETNKINFPDNMWDFIIDNSFKDTEKVYSNGVLLIPTYRVKQAIDYYCKPREGE